MAAKIARDREATEQLEAFRQNIVTTAEDIVFRIFPQKMNDLHNVLEFSSNEESPYHPSHAPGFTDTTVYPSPRSESEEPEVKKRKRVEENGHAHRNDTQYATYPNLVRANGHLPSIHKDVKRESEELATNIDKLKLWINLTMPKIEDGDNFGVQIQEEVLQELHRSQDSAYSIRDSYRQNHLNRAKICSKLIKYPNIEDYTIALQEHDQKQLFASRQHLVNIRDIYAVIADIIYKNISKIRAPKANNSQGLY